jgi:hypothetical protein
VKPHLCALEGPTSPKGLVGHSRSKLNLSKSIDIPCSAQPENERRASVFQGTHILDCVRGKAFEVPYVPANSGGVAT